MFIDCSEPRGFLLDGCGAYLAWHDAVRGIGLPCVVIAPGPYSGAPDETAVPSALLTLKLRAHEAVWVTADPEHVRFGVRLGLGTILYGASAETRTLPDFEVRGRDELEAVVRRQNLGWFGEVMGTYSGRPPRCLGTSGYTFSIPPWAGIPQDRVSIRALGRYFNRTDPRALRHQLTSRLKHAKTSPVHDILLARMVGGVLKRYRAAGAAIAWVPPHSDSRDHIGSILQAEARLRSEERPPNMIRAVGSWSKQHQSADGQARWENVEGKFAADRVQGGQAVVVDDVLTSGSTLGTAMVTLLEAGYEHVTGIVMARTQWDVVVPGCVPPCPKCNTPMRVQFNRRDAGAFWGCPNYRECGCTGVPFFDGLQTANGLRAVEPVDEDEVPF